MILDPNFEPERVAQKPVKIE